MGTIIWKEAGTQAVLNGPFQRGMVYNAEVSLTPMMGYSFTGVRQNTFIHTGAETITNPADRGMVHIGFSATSNAGALVVYDTNLSGRIPQPAAGVTPLSGIAGTQYAGTISWDPSPYNTFQAEVAYTAVLTLIAVPGYTFTGVGENAFHHMGAKTITNPADSGSITIRFPPAPSSINPVKSFGPVEKEGSALKLIKERKDDVYPLIIDLPPGYEEIETGVLLSAGANNIIINGQNRVLKIKNPGAFITVGAGVTLTLWNIRFEGHGSNNSPLFKVRPGGKLILENGAVLVGNQSAGDVGGVWVNGGSLSLYNGAVIQKMRGQRGGGVLIDTGGQFAMNGGTIGGELAADGNIVSSEHGGGGVLVAVGSFDMNGGKIQYNTALAANSGGGVLVSEKGTFNMYDGAIKENTAAFSNGDYNNLIFSTGGGVHVDRGIFTMDGVDALIAGNRSETLNSGGAVYNNGTFIMNNGIIRKNTGPSFYAGGGVHTDASFTMNNGIIQGNTVQSNYSGGGVFVRYSGTFIMNGGTIKGNIAENNANYSGGGVFLRDGGTFLMNGGTIGGKNQGDANIASGPDGFANGVYGIPGNFIMAGGIITGNTAASNNTGVCIGGEFTMKGSAQVAKDNIVLLKDNSKITIGGTLQVSPAANIKCAITPKVGTYLLKANSSALISGNYTKFLYNGQENHINGTPYQADSLWYGQYK
jgi:hypothetical protein